MRKKKNGNRLQITDNNSFTLFDFKLIDCILHKQWFAISNGSLRCAFTCVVISLSPRVTQANSITELKATSKSYKLLNATVNKVVINNRVQNLMSILSWFEISIAQSTTPCTQDLFLTLFFSAADVDDDDVVFRKKKINLHRIFFFFCVSLFNLLWNVPLISLYKNEKKKTSRNLH